MGKEWGLFRSLNEEPLYIYLDESGDICWANRETQPFFVLVALVIKDKRSKKAIANAVTRATVEVRQRRQSSDRVRELKGHLLRDHNDVRLRLFKRIIRRARVSIFALVLDKRRIKQKVPASYAKSYSLCAINLLTQIPIPRLQRWVTMVVDSQARAARTQPSRVRYPSKRKRKEQSRLRILDRAKRQHFDRTVGNFFRKFLKKKGTHLRIWQRRSEEDRCIQAVDVISNWVHERWAINEYRARKLASLSASERQAVSGFKWWKRTQRKSMRWQDCREAIGRHLKIMRPHRLYRRKLHMLVSAMLKGRLIGGNRGA